MPTLGPKACKYDLHWAIWIPRVLLGFQVFHRFAVLPMLVYVEPEAEDFGFKRFNRLNFRRSGFVALGFKGSESVKG